MQSLLGIDGGKNYDSVSFTFPIEVDETLPKGPYAWLGEGGSFWVDMRAALAPRAGQAGRVKVTLEVEWDDPNLTSSG